MNWLEHVEKWKDCQRCPLGQQRFRICLARGCVPATVLFVGEAPGMSEDVSGLPFVGPAGELLDNIISRALPKGLPIAFINLVGCYPRVAKETDNHQPERGEILECRPRVVEFVNIAKPKLIVRVGSLVHQYLNFDTSVPLVDIDHPAYILRMPPAQKPGAVQRSIVRVRNAYEDALQSPTEFQEWGVDNADRAKARRQQLRKTYSDAEQ